MTTIEGFYAPPAWVLDPTLRYLREHVGQVIDVEFRPSPEAEPQHVRALVAHFDDATGRVDFEAQA